MSALCLPVVPVVTVAVFTQSTVLWLALAVAVLAVAIWFLAIGEAKKALIFVLAVLLFASAAAVRTSVAVFSHAKAATLLAEDLDGREHIFLCQAKDDIASSGGMTLKLLQVGDKRLRVDVTAYAYNSVGHYIHADETLLITAKLRIPRTKQNESFDFAGWLASRGIYAELYEISDCKPMPGVKTSGFYGIGSRLRELALKSLEKVLGYIPDKDGYERAFSLSEALLFGNRSGFTDDQKEDFVRSGVSHVVSVSGLHFSLLLSGIGLVLRYVLRSRSARFAVLTAVGVVYLFMCAFTPAALRSALMAFLAGAGFAENKKGTSLASLLSAVAIICLVSPETVLGVGFALSVLATAGLIITSVLLQNILHRIGRNGFFGVLVGLLHMSLAASAFTFFYSACAFGAVSTVSVIASTIITPLAELCLSLAWIGILFGMLPLSGIHMVLGSVIGVLAKDIFALAEMFASFSFAYTEIALPAVQLPVFLATLSIAALASCKKNGGTVLYLVLLISSVLTFLLVS